MKRTLIFALLLCVISTAIFAQAERRIYLWDVTLSMKGVTSAGFDASKNIYDDVKNFLLKEIASIQNENTEIVVLPFRVGVLEKWTATANERGKREISEKIKRGIPDQMTMTDIVSSVEYVMNNVINPDRRNVVMLLTDGMQSNRHGGESALMKMIRDWGQKYKGKNYAFLQYVVLTEEAGLSANLKKAIQDEPLIELRRFVNLRTTESLTVNVKEDRTASIFLTYEEDVELPENISIRLSTQDGFNFVQDVVIKEGKISFEITDDFISQLQDSVTSLQLLMELLNREEIENADGAIVFLARSLIDLELINAPEKLLEVNFKERLKGGNNWGRVRFYKNFLWKKYKPEREMKVQTLRFEFNEYAMSFPNAVAEFEIFKKSEGGRDIPATGVLLFRRNGDRVEKLPNNVLRVCKSEANVDGIAEIIVGIAFTDAAEKGRHLFFLREIGNDVRVDLGDLANGFLVEKRMVRNPLAKTLFWIFVIIVAGLIVWRIFINPLMYDRFKVRTLYFISDDEGMKTVKIKGCVKVVCSRRKQSQSLLSQFFTGKIAFVQSDFWEQNMEILPKDKKSVRVRPGRGFAVSPSNTVALGTDTDITNIDTNKIIKLKIN